MNRFTLWLVLFLAAAVYGTFMEWAIGAIWDIVGECPYVYPASPLTYSSLIMMPVWGLAGLQAAVIYLAITRRQLKMLLWLVGLVALTIALVVVSASI
ncbi:hypothetical protein ACFLXL_02485 [Chloroflexota bacterium]